MENIVQKLSKNKVVIVTIFSLTLHFILLLLQSPVTSGLPENRDTVQTTLTGRMACGMDASWIDQAHRYIVNRSCHRAG